MDKDFLRAKDVSEILGVSVSASYRVIKQLNEEMKAKGYITFSGRVNREYFLERTCYVRKEMK